METTNRLNAQANKKAMLMKKENEQEKRQVQTTKTYTSIDTSTSEQY